MPPSTTASSPLPMPLSSRVRPQCPSLLRPRCCALRTHLMPPPIRRPICLNRSTRLHRICPTPLTSCCPLLAVIPLLSRHTGRRRQLLLHRHLCLHRLQATHLPPTGINSRPLVIRACDRAAEWTRRLSRSAWTPFPLVLLPPLLHPSGVVTRQNRRRKRRRLLFKAGPCWVTMFAPTAKRPMFPAIYPPVRLALVAVGIRRNVRCIRGQ